VQYQSLLCEEEKFTDTDPYYLENLKNCVLSWKSTHAYGHMCGHHKLTFVVISMKLNNQIRLDLRIGDKLICGLEPLALNLLPS